MKKARYVSVAVAGLFALASVVHADIAPTATSADDNDPHLKYDQDGIPLAVTQKQAERPTAAQLAEDRKERAQAQLDKDWLLRAYEKQLQTHTSTSTTLDQNANPYQEISADKDLAKLAGLTDFRADSPSEEPLYRTKDAQGVHAVAALRPGSSAPILGSAPFGSSFLSPMITPLSAPETAGLKSFYASLPGSGFAPFNGSTPAPAPPPRKSVVPDPTDNDIETPGMIAAKNDPNADPNALNSDLDVLPGESIEHAKAHQDKSESMLQLPIVMDADELHREQAAYLNPPVAKPADPYAKTAAVTPDKPKTPPLEDYHEPVPISQMPMISPVRAPIANPYSILNR